MKKLPAWLRNLARKNSCPRCSTPIDIEHIMGMGVKESHKHKGKDVLFFEYFCTSCEDVFVFELDFAPTDDMLASMLGTDEDEEELRVAKSGITDKEVNKLKEFLKKSKYFEDFLIEIGVSQSDIDKLGKRINCKGK